MKTTIPLCLIVALAKNHVIGRNNQLPWHLPADLKHFKAKTLGKPIIMGRKTWDSLGRPLPGRLNLVVSRQAELKLDGAEVFHTLEAAVRRADEHAQEKGIDEIMLIGGAQLYEQALPFVKRMYLTWVGLSPNDGDAWFPQFEHSEWVPLDLAEHRAEGELPSYDFEVLERRA
jgi:dihydrofolate reductase